MRYDILINTLIASGAKSATRYESDKLVRRATRRMYGKKIRTGKNVPIEIHLHIGRPNYLEREFIKLCKKAKEPFPIRKLQLKFPKQ